MESSAAGAMDGPLGDIAQLRLLPFCVRVVNSLNRCPLFATVTLPAIVRARHTGKSCICFDFFYRMRSIECVSSFWSMRCSCAALWERILKF